MDIPDTLAPRFSVLVVTQQIGSVISGIGLHALNLVEYLTDHGHQVYVMAPEDQRPSGDLPYPFIGVPPPLGGKTQARWISLSLSFARALERAKLDYSFDLVHFTDAREALFCRANIPMVGNMNDTYAAMVKPLSFYRRYFNDGLLRWTYYNFVHLFEPVALQRLQAVIANSNYTQAAIIKAYSIPAQKLHVCHKSIYSSRYAASLTMREQVAPHPPRLLFVGGNMQRKGLPVLIKAASRVLENCPSAEFWIAGKDKAQPFMQSLCARAGVDRSFRFLGWKSQEDLLELYAQTDIFVMPSLTEAFGVVFLEAMAAGLPVIGTNVGGIPEIIENRRNGVLVDAADVQGLGDAILLLIRDQALRENLRQAGIDTAQRFNVDNMMECTFQVYRSVLSNH